MKQLSDFLGKEVQLYPRDTYEKYAILLEYNEHGYMFKITKSKEVTYKEGDIIFINHATNVIFKLKK